MKSIKRLSTALLFTALLASPALADEISDDFVVPTSAEPAAAAPMSPYAPPPRIYSAPSERRFPARPVDVYDDSQSHPLRIAAYLVHPVGYALEWLIFRPFHWVVAQPSLVDVFGHEPHPAYSIKDESEVFTYDLQ